MSDLPALCQLSIAMAQAMELPPCGYYHFEFDFDYGSVTSLELTLRQQEARSFSAYNL